MILSTLSKTYSLPTSERKETRKFKVIGNNNQFHSIIGVKNMNKTQTIGILLIIVGALMVLHHVCHWQRLFDMKDILHHEFFEAIFFTAGVTLLISNHYNEKRCE